MPDDSPVDFAALQQQYPELSEPALKALAAELEPPRWWPKVQALRERQRRLLDPGAS